MTDPRDRRKDARTLTRVRIAWRVVEASGEQIDRLRDVSRGGARVATRAVARVGDEIRFDLLDDGGERFASGLARVTWVDPARGMGIEFAALGVEGALVDRLVAQASAAPSEPPRRKRKVPPPLPATPPGPPPLPAPPPLDARAEPEDDAVAPQVEPLPVRRAGVIIGIDLGTTNTCASHVVDGQARIIPGRTGTNTIPSMITFDPDGTAYVGQRAADRQVLHPLRTVYGSKRLVGRTFRADAAARLQQHFAYPLAEADGQRYGVRVDDRVVSMDRIAALVLEEVRTTAEEHLGTRVEAAVITVPAYFSEVQRDAVRRAAREANLAVHRIVNEPTAAAVAYGAKQATKKARIAVWDFGGGTFDFSIVEVEGGRLEVLATGGDNFVGGQDLDDLVASHVLGEFQRVHGLDVDPTPQQIARLREAGEVAKRALSAQTEVTIDLAELTRDPRRDAHVELTRAAFEAMAAPLIERTLAIAREVMEKGGTGIKDIDDVLLVGGTTRIPAVQRAVAQLFGRRPSKRINPDEAVAHGAALLADEIGAADAPVLLDILPMSVGYGEPGLRFTPIVARHTRLPTHREVRVPADLLGSLSLHLFQGESPDVSRGEYLCTVTVEDASLCDKGKVALRLAFDEMCVMSVDARNARTGQALPVRIDRVRSLDAILAELGKYTGPKVEEVWQPPVSRLGRVLGKLFKAFGRG